MAWTLAVLVASACASTEPERAPRRDGRPITAPDAGRPNLGRWELADRLGELRRVSRIRSQHLGGGLEGEIAVNEQAGSYPGSGGGRPPAVGAVLAETHFPPGSTEPSVVFAMVKRQPGFDPAGADWEYLVVAPNGDIEARGRLPGCARCHAEAPAEGVFGPPRGPDAGL